MHDFDSYVETQIEQLNAAASARLERRQRVREALAGRQGGFYRPLLVSVGKRMVLWGTQLQRRYDDRRSAGEVTLAMQHDS